LQVCLTKRRENRGSIHDLHSKPTFRSDDAGDLPQDRVVLLVGVEESEGVDHDRSVDGAGSERQSAHVAANPPDRGATLGRDLAGALQQRGCSVNADDVSACFGEGDGMAPMTTTDIDDGGAT
jgi:hypothetical protein